MKPPLSHTRSKSANFDWLSSIWVHRRGNILYTASVLDLLPSKGAFKNCATNIRCSASTLLLIKISFNDVVLCNTNILASHYRGEIDIGLMQVDN